MFSFFTGRSNRQEYWASVALLIVAALVLEALHMQAASAAITIMWVITWIRRLHDIGKPGWLSLIPLGIVLALAIGGLVIGGNAFVKTMTEAETTGAMPPMDRDAYIFMGVVFAGLIVQFGFTIWLGVRKGDAGNNRFGPPPGAAAS